MSNSNTKINDKITPSELILSAVFFLQKNGVSEKDIINYISEKRNCNQSDVKDRVKLLLNEGIKKGIFAKKKGLYTIKKQCFGKISSLKNNKVIKEEKRRRKPKSLTPETMECDFDDSNESFKKEEKSNMPNSFIKENRLKMKLSVSSTSHLEDYDDAEECNEKNTRAAVSPNMNFVDDDDDNMEEYDDDFDDEGDDSDRSGEYGNNKFIDKNQNPKNSINDNEGSYYDNEYINNDEEVCTTGEEFDEDPCPPKKKRKKAKPKASKQKKKNNCPKKQTKRKGGKKGGKAAKKKKKKKIKKVMCCRCKETENNDKKEKKESKRPGSEGQDCGPVCGSYCDETICNCKNTKKSKEKDKADNDKKCEEKCKAECEKNKNKNGKNGKGGKSESPKGSPGKDGNNSESRESAMSLTENEYVPMENECSEKKNPYKRKRQAECSSHNKSKISCKERKTVNGRSTRVSEY